MARHMGYWAGVGILAIATAGAAAEPSRLPARFARGVNVSGWMWGTGWDNRPYSDADFRLIRSVGFTCVRLPVDFKFLHDPQAPAELRAEGLARLVEGLRTLKRHDLGALLDIHQAALDGLKDSNYSAALEDPQFVARYAAFWKALAAAASRELDPEWLILQPMNEPVFNRDPAIWPSIQERIVSAIREAAPRHWIVACGARWQSREELLKLKPLADRRIVYDFHFYDPFPFTHQGAGWAGDSVKDLKGIPYPPEPARVRDLLPRLADERARREVEWMAKQEWGPARIEAEMGRVAAWGREHGVPLMCSEFGVYARVAPVADRLQWYRDVTGALEKHGIAWAVWNYREEHFGVAQYRAPGEPKARGELIAALGLKAGPGTAPSRPTP